MPQEDTPLALQSVKSGKPYRIIGEELRRLRSLAAPLPRLAYDERMHLRLQRCGGIRLYQRHCDKSGRELLTIHPPEAPYPVWEKDLLEMSLG